MADSMTTNDHDESEPLLLGPTVRKILAPLASLKLTVTLLAMAVFIVLAGTLAQTQKDIWQVVDEYFRTTSKTLWFAWIDWQIFFPKAFFPNWMFDQQPQIPGGFWFPGGWMIGAAMAVNLFAAHAVRFTVQARGARLNTGLAVIAAGMVVTWMVIAGGSSDGLQGQPFFRWETLWMLVKFGLVGVSLFELVAGFQLGSERRTERRVLITTGIAVGALVAWLFYQGDSVALGDSSMRILWQLIQGTLAGLVLLAGCALVFKKRAGIVLLHGGIGLLMFSELLVGTTAIEGQMHIKEGETVNFVQDIRTVELAVVDSSDPKEDVVVVVPQHFLKQKELIQHKELPFDVEVVKYLPNTAVPRQLKDEKSLATAGAGLAWTVEERRPGTGTDMGGKVDMTAAYVKLLKKGTQESLGTHLVSLWQGMMPVMKTEKVSVDGKTYDVSLRFKRTYKTYAMTLKDVRFDKYIGTETAKNYSSELHLVDPTRQVDRDVKIWMNNPLRFAGETFYQSTFDQDPMSGSEMTGLSVVSNTGWMIPYVSCMIVAVGLLAQFSISLTRFLKRKYAVKEPGRVAPVVSTKTKSRDDDRSDTPSRFTFEKLFPLLVVAVFAAWLGSKARPPSVAPDAPKLYDFGKLPVVYEGRVKPMDTLARTTLKIISSKETALDSKDKPQPAIRWFLDTISESPEADKYQVFWIDNPDLIKSLGLARKKSHLYSIEEIRGAKEIRPEMRAFVDEARAAHDQDVHTLTAYQRKVMELYKRIRSMSLLFDAFRPHALPPFPTFEDMEKDRTGSMQKLREIVGTALEAGDELAKFHPPLAIYTKASPFRKKQSADAKTPEREWKPYATALTDAIVENHLLGTALEPEVATWGRMLLAFSKGDTKEFNSELDAYRKLLDANPPPDIHWGKLNFEAFFNHYQTFYHASVLYVVCFLIAAMAWLGWSVPLNRAAFWLMAFTLAFHSFAIIARIYISGRPPVTNLYSTAPFIGWACVLGCQILERIFRNGIGNVVGGVIGFGTLLISHFLAGDGDTFTVMQAVLDTQFWLATHVVTMNLGYAMTILAGVLSVFYLVRGVATPSLTPQIEKDFARMIYGTLCFALFTSFVGTVLGGLWADDSWGRFWGWDPKENGALIIVLWNALVLHARWEGMVKDRGLAVLAVAGNIATGWSWFGVNELGVGLHSYGFTEGVLKNLAWFMTSQLAVIALGCLPRKWWWSGRRNAANV